MKDCAASRASAVVVLNDKLETPAPFQAAGLNAVDHLVVEHDAPAAQARDFERRGLEFRFPALTESQHE